MARPGRPERNRAARSFRQLRRFHRVINSNKVFGTHSQQFDVVLAEALDRISRDQADVATLFKHLRFAGVPIITLAEGEISELHVGLKGTMNALFLKDLAAKTHRGLRGRVEDGKSGGGLCYGYRVVKKLDERGEQRVRLDPSRGWGLRNRIITVAAAPEIDIITRR